MICIPYRARGTQVQVQRNGRWVPMPGGKHRTHAEAVRHAQALNINVRHEKTQNDKKQGP